MKNHRGEKQHQNDMGRMQNMDYQQLETIQPMNMMPIQTDMNVNMGYTPQIPKGNFNTITHPN